MGFYFADFVCFEHQLVIELDGAYHEGSEYDLVRDEYLCARGFRVLRFWNHQVRDDLPSVLSSIRQALASNLLSPLAGDWHSRAAEGPGVRGPRDK